MSKRAMDTKPYDATFKILMRYCPELLISLINFAFREHFDTGEPITFLQSEVRTTGEDGGSHPRIADSVFRLVNFTYHVECQAYGDDTIQMRLVETGFGTAIRERKSRPGVTEVEYPRQAVLYLSCPKSTPDAEIMRLKTPGGLTVQWTIPIIKLANLDLDAIFERDLFFLLPFCLFRYGREGLKKCDRDESKLAELRAMLGELLERLNEAMAAGKISDFNRSMVLDALNYVSRKLSDGYDNVTEAVKSKMGEEFIEFPTMRKLREAREEGALQILFGLVNDGIISSLEASKRVKIPEADFRAQMAQYQGA